MNPFTGMNPFTRMNPLQLPPSENIYQTLPKLFMASVENVIVDGRAISNSTSFYHGKQERYGAFRYLEITQGILLITINFLLLVFIASRKKLRKKKTNLLFINLLLVHILTGILFIVSYFTTDVSSHIIVTIINNGFLMESFESMIFISYEQVIAIKYSFRYTKISRKHIFVLTGLSWIIPIVFVSSAVQLEINVDVCLIVNTVLILLTFSALCSTSTFIDIIAKRHDDIIRTNASKAVNLKKANTLKASFVCFAIVLTFVFFWAPHLIHNIMVLSSIYVRKVREDSFSKIVDHLAYLNGLADPILFIWLSRSTKKELKKYLCLKKRT